MREKIKKISLSAFACAFLSVCSIISIPTPFGVPFTLQTFAVCLTGLFLPLKYSLCSYLAYITLGVFGIPIFSALGSGIGVILGATGGFLSGFVFLMLFAGLSAKKAIKIRIVFCVIGLVLCHISGFCYFSYITSTPIVSAILVSSAPFIIKDIILVFLSIFIHKRIVSHL
ncbi:MAG: biotin transporter BioY [Clostridia bacterium]|nr:biotin transporter BioY [Clostridia bacterium]